MIADGDAANFLGGVVRFGGDVFVNPSARFAQGAGVFRLAGVSAFVCNFARRTRFAFRVVAVPMKADAAGGGVFAEKLRAGSVALVVGVAHSAFAAAGGEEVGAVVVGDFASVGGGSLAGEHARATVFALRHLRGECAFQNAAVAVGVVDISLQALPAGVPAERRRSRPGTGGARPGSERRRGRSRGSRWGRGGRFRRTSPA